MENNYPVKYTLQPVYEQFGHLNGVFGNEPNYSISFYVVTKCYVVEDIKKYFKDGSTEQYYNVVFPIKFLTTDSLLNDSEDFQEPEFNYNNECYNKNKTSKIYDSFEEAITDRIIKNKERFFNYLIGIKDETVKNKIKMDFFKNVEHLQNEVMKSTLDIKIKKKVNN